MLKPVYWGLGKTIQPEQVFNADITGVQPRPAPEPNQPGEAAFKPAINHTHTPLVFLGRYVQQDRSPDIWMLLPAAWYFGIL